LTNPLQLSPLQLSIFSKFSAAPILYSSQSSAALSPSKLLINPIKTKEYNNAGRFTTSATSGKTSWISWVSNVFELALPFAFSLCPGKDVMLRQEQEHSPRV
jgi:hypothetical protein